MAVRKLYKYANHLARAAHICLVVGTFSPSYRKELDAKALLVEGCKTAEKWDRTTLRGKFWYGHFVGCTTLIGDTIKLWSFVTTHLDLNASDSPISDVAMHLAAGEMSKAVDALFAWLEPKLCLIEKDVRQAIARFVEITKWCEDDEGERIDGRKVSSIEAAALLRGETLRVPDVLKRLSVGAKVLHADAIPPPGASHSERGGPKPPKIPDASEGDDGYVEAGKLWPRYDFIGYKEFRCWLDGSDVRHEQRGQRRMVHAADLARAMAERDKQRDEALDIAGDIATGVREGASAIRRQNEAKK